MGIMTLASILLTQLPRIQTTGGDVLHAMKQSDAGYGGFGEAYFSWVAVGAIKGWKRHTRMAMNLVVPLGEVRFVFRSVHATENDEFRIEDIGVNRYVRITVPPGIWFGFQGLGAQQSLVLNIASIAHDPDEVERLALSEVNYSWN